MKRVLKIGLSLLILLSFTACTAKELSTTNYGVTEKPRQFAFQAFDTQCSLSLYGVGDNTVAMTYCDDMERLLRNYEKALSKTDEEGDVYAINNRTTDSVMITEVTATLFELGPDLYNWSGRKFDISSGTLIDLWDVKNRKTLPTKEEINEARSHCGNFNYVVEHDVAPGEYQSCRITFSGDKKTKYDLGALGKGYTCDALKEMLGTNDIIKACIINLGGNVCVTGKLDGRPNGAFNVGIFKPFSGNDIIDTVKVTNRNVVTSGTYQRFFKIDGDERVYHHVIDPTTGYPTDNGYNSVTIVSENGLLGDYLSTACLLLGEKDSMDLIDFCKKSFDDSKIQAIFVDSNNNVTRYPKNVKFN